MNLQINLLRKTERRYQGIVSMKIMAFAIVGVFLGVTMLVFSMAGLSKMTLNANLERSRREWQHLEPLAAAARANQTALAANGRVLSEIEKHTGNEHPPMHRVLLAVQKNIPLQTVLEHFYAGKEQADDGAPVYYVLRASGRSLGELTAVEARRNLNAAPDLRRFCGDIRLISSQRADGDNWLFALEGRRHGEGDER